METTYQTNKDGTISKITTEVNFQGDTVVTTHIYTQDEWQIEIDKKQAAIDQFTAEISNAQNTMATLKTQKINPIK